MTALTQFADNKRATYTIQWFQIVKKIIIAWNSWLGKLNTINELKVVRDIVHHLLPVALTEFTNNKHVVWIKSHCPIDLSEKQSPRYLVRKHLKVGGFVS